MPKEPKEITKKRNSSENIMASADEIGVHSYGAENYRDETMMMNMRQTYKEYMSQIANSQNSDTVRSHESNSKHKGFPK